jgi:hypothetical protein
MSFDIYCKFRTIPLQDAKKYCEVVEKDGRFWLKTPQGGTLLTDSQSEDGHISQLTGYLGGTSDDRWDVAIQVMGGEDNIIDENEWVDMIYDHSLAEGTIWEFPSEEEIEAYKKEHPEMFETPQELNDISEEDEINFDNL